MATVRKPKLPPVRELTPEEGRAYFDACARELTGMSGEEFLRRFDSGEFDDILDEPEYPHLMHLWMLIPFARQ